MNSVDSPHPPTECSPPPGLLPDAGPALGDDGEIREPCPTPLSWQQVLAMFVQERTRHEITVDRHRFVAWSWGDPDAHPIFVLGGMTTTPETLSLFAHLLRENFRCVLIDDPGVDEKLCPRRRLLEDFGRDVVATADALGADRFSLTGIGWGSMVALQTMLDAPARIDRALLVSGYARLHLSLFERSTFRLARWSPGSLGWVPMQRTMTEQNHRRWFPPFDQTRWDFFATETNRVPFRIVGARASAVINTDLRSRLGEIRCPVMLVRGEGEGRMQGLRQEELTAGLPAPHLEWMHSTGQLAFLTHPHRLNKLVKTFHGITGTKS